MQILNISPEQAREQNSVLMDLSKQGSTLFFDDYINTLEPWYSKVDELPDEIKIAKPLANLLQGDLEPARVIDLRPVKDHLYYGKCPMWRNRSNKEFSLHGFGLIENNRNAPFVNALFDQSPHLLFGGSTGTGKSVTVNSLLCAGAIAHPPWKANYYLVDPKVVELLPFVSSPKILPHVNVVGATADADYTISLLEYVIDVMTKRNAVFSMLGIKNITAFVEKTGLEMPMMILLLDEVGSLYNFAGRKAGKIDSLISGFVALARSAGGRCIMCSQQTVEGMAQATMLNINQRAALGCAISASNKMIGNPGASINVGVPGKIVFNANPSNGDVKDNIHLVAPFIPDFATPESRVVQDVFAYISDIWDECGGGRLEPISYYNEEIALTREQFLSSLKGNANLDAIFLGEPVFIYKGKFLSYTMSLLPPGEYDDSQMDNLIFISPIGKMRYLFLDLFLANLEEIRKKRPIKVNFYGNIRETVDKVKSMGWTLDLTDYAMDVEQLFWARTKAITYRYIVCTADERIFDNKPLAPNANRDAVVEMFTSIGASELMKKRAAYICDLLNEQKQLAILGINPLTEKTQEDYFTIVRSISTLYTQNGCESKQLLPSMLPVQFHIFAEFDQLKGVEIKTVMQKLDMFFDMVRLGSTYRVHTIIVTGPVPSAAPSMQIAFKHVISYGVQGQILTSFKIREEYPETLPPNLFVYANRLLSSDYCFKIKFPEMLGPMK